MKLCLLLVFLGTLAAVPGVLRAQVPELPPITDEERALTFVPGEPNAPAVVLFRKGELLMRGYGTFFGSYNSHLRVQTRVKILTERGRSRGEVTVVHSQYARLANFSGRTILPDGTIIPVPADAKFHRNASRSKGVFVMAVAFPSVQVGAILDYQYELVFSSPIDLDPWYLSDPELPVRRAEILYETDGDLRMQFWSRSPLGVVIHKEETDSLKGHELRAWAENLPSLPDEPQGPLFEDLAAQVLLLPAVVHAKASDPYSLFETWRSTSDLFLNFYSTVSSRNNGVQKQVRAIASSGTPRQKAEALYRFVRDEIHTEPAVGLAVEVNPDTSLTRVLSKRRGTGIEKALLLGSMLNFAQIKSKLIWARDRGLGSVTDPKAPNPGWFDAVLLSVDLDGQQVFLDPADSDLGFGQIPVAYEGTAALIPGLPPAGLTLPAIPFDQSLRRAELELTLDTAGRLAGSGTLLRTGRPGEENVPDWKEWLGSRFREFQIADVKVIEAPDERKVTVTWTQTQRQEEVLGDEVSLVPSAPLGPLAQPFVQTPAQRRTSVTFDYPHRDEVVLRLHWPEGWKVEEKPAPVAIDSPPGAILSASTLDAGERTLLYHRRLDILHWEVTTAQYEALRSLFSALEKNDGQKILLVRRP